MSDKGNQQEFLTRLRRGEHQAIKQLYDEAFNYCASFVQKNSGTKEDAKDVFQEVLLVLLKNLRDKHFVIQHDLKAYLYKTTKNLWYNRLRANKKNGLYLVVDDPKINTDITQKNEDPQKKALEERHQKLYAAIKQLKEDCQEILHYTFFNKLSNQEIATMRGYTNINFVSQKRKRCIQYLKTKMEK